ncbi:MAG: hypothetical protein KAU06_08350 [Candidatus Marinimicrobia bacterium]|nr:hypothetical protein [Candidatus Neomarinimicrobiota bacterium]
MSRILISLLLCSVLIIAQDSTDTVESITRDSTNIDESREQVLSPNFAADSLLAIFSSTEQDTSQMKLLDKSKIILRQGKDFVLDHRKELGVTAGFGVLMIYFIAEIMSEEEKPDPEIGYPPDWPGK